MAAISTYKISKVSWLHQTLGHQAGIMNVEVTGDNMFKCLHKDLIEHH
jgi:hypothetical protein